MELFVLLLSLPIFGSAIKNEFDNALTGSPSVSCNRGSISLDIPSSHGAPSVVFAKGHFNKDDCSFRNATHITFDFDKCNIRRKREVNPKGMAYSMTVVVQLHPLFITKVDKAYAVRCFYMEAEKNVGSELKVNELTTQLLSQENEQPTCVYSLHKESSNGPLVRYAHVGDTVYHVWDCPSDSYAMMIHSCVVQDGQGQESKVVDENGCSTDTYLMPELVYNKDLTRTFTAVNAFNFPDVTSVQFSCQIKLCFKGSGGCDSITPPRCNGNIGHENNKEVEVINETTTKNNEELEKEEFLTTSSSKIIDDLIFGEVQDTNELTSESTIASSPSTTSTTTSPSTTTSEEIITTTIVYKRDNDTESTPFPTPKSLRDFIKTKYGDSIEGSGLENELNEREEKRDIKRRDTDTLDLDISSPELTILDKESDGYETERPRALSSKSPMVNSVCVPLTAFWLLIGLVLLSLSFILAAIYKSSSKQGFVQF